MARMKRVGARNRQIYTQVVDHYSKPARQNVGDTATMPCFGQSRAERTVNVISLNSGARKIRTIKGTRFRVY